MSLVGFKAQNHPQQKAKPQVDDRALPMVEFEKLNAEFRFTVDAAASAENAKLPRYYSIENCGLKASWAGERVYCNPPYSNISPWVQKAAFDEPDAELIVMVLPANRTEQMWWQKYIEPFRDRPGGWLTTRFLSGRMRFLKPGQGEIGPNERPPFGIVLCIWSGGLGDEA